MAVDTENYGDNDQCQQLLLYNRRTFRKYVELEGKVRMFFNYFTLNNSKNYINIKL